MTELAPHPTLRALRGMVSAPDHLAAGAGAATLRAGGTAADAAVAASAVLAVVAPHQCGVGGDLWALVHRDGDARPAALDASGRAGSGADPERLRAEGHAVMPPLGDIRSVTVPGCVDGWLALHARFGRLALGEVLAPAVAHARDGFPLSPALAASVGAVAHLPAAADFVAAGAPRPGAVVRRPGVARTLEAIAGGGRDAFYGGEFGAGLLALGRGEYVSDDLSRPLADFVEAIGADAWERRVWSAPPASQGYVALGAAWIAAGLPLPAPEDGRWAHLLVEALRQAAADRDDVWHERSDGAALVDPARLAPRRAAIDPLRARAPAGASAAGGTVGVVAVDADRLGVSLLQSNFVGWGAHLAVEPLGIFLHVRGLGFSLVPGHPAEYGPGRRPPHTLSPLLATREDGRLDLALATMGGHAQPAILLQLLARRLAAGREPGDVVAAPRWVLGDDAVLVEDRVPADWAPRLRAAAHRVALRPAWSPEFGHAQAVAVEGEALAGGSDPRPLGGAVAGV